MRRLLYEGITEDQYSEILARSGKNSKIINVLISLVYIVPEHQHLSTGDRKHSSTNLDCSSSNPDSSGVNPDRNDANADTGGTIPANGLNGLSSPAESCLFV